MKHIPARPGRQEDRDGRQAEEAQERAFQRFAVAREASRTVQALRGFGGGWRTAGLQGDGVAVFGKRES